MKNLKSFIKETEMQKAAREKIKREKEADKVKHDRMMDAARRRDTVTANQKEEVEVAEARVEQKFVVVDKRKIKIKRLPDEISGDGRMKYIEFEVGPVDYLARDTRDWQANQALKGFLKGNRKLKAELDKAIMSWSWSKTPDAKNPTGIMSFTTRIMKEEVEQVDEISKSTAMSYIQKAYDSDRKMADKQTVAQRKQDYKTGDAISKKRNLRQKGINRATQKMFNKEDVEFHVRLDHLDGDKRQKKAGDVMNKHEKAGHIKYAGSTDKGVIFKAKSKQHADRLHRELKPHATGVEHMNEAKSAQDPDIKDREGTQPAAYHKGLKKSTKAKRDAHFKKHGKKADDDASAYKDAPGDKKARKEDMPKSKYTKFVDNMMKEGTDFAAHRAAKATAPSDSDRKKMAKVADLLRKEREKKAAEKIKEEYHVVRPKHKGGSLSKPDSIHKNKQEAIKHAYRLSGKKHMGERGAQVFRVHNKQVTHAFDTEGRSRHLNLDHDKITGKKSIWEESGFAEKSKKSGISVNTLRKVYNRGVAAWKTGHRPGTTPQQWGHARVNAFITKKKKGGLNHDKDLA